ncbi:MAG: hypothetical protein ACM3YE_04895 [Bacteroidota bacterium]
MNIKGDLIRYTTLNDVVKMARVFLAIASRALNNRGDIDEATRKKCLKRPRLSPKAAGED